MYIAIYNVILCKYDIKKILMQNVNLINFIVAVTTFSVVIQITFAL